ncbi:MAG: gliding motility-associated C-terminal domain-containing protein, partial [Bacteroidota bacterium]
YETGYSNLTMHVSGTANCSGMVATDKRRIIINSNIIADAGPDLRIPYDSLIILQGTATGGSGSYHYAWQPASLLNNANIIHPETIGLTKDVTFTLQITDLFTGCTGSDSVVIRVNKPDTTSVECLVIYNVITPNGDGTNDDWIIDCITDHPLNKVTILDRWGNLVHSFENYNNSSVVWKGTNERNERVPDGTYYYILTLKNGMTYKGWVMVRGGTN